MTDNSEIKIKATGKGCYKTEAIVNDNIVHSENGNGLDCTYMVNFADQASANNAISRSPVNRQTFRICIVGYGNNNRSDKAEASVTVVKDNNPNYTVTYNYNGGNGPKISDTVKKGKSVILPDAVRPEYLFSGWYTSLDDDNSKVGNVGDSFTVTDNVNLYAHWIYRNNHTLSNAYTVDIDDMVCGNIGSSSQIDFYRIIFDGSGNIEFKLTIPDSARYTMRLLDENANLLDVKKGNTGETRSIIYNVQPNVPYIVRINADSATDVVSNENYTLQFVPSIADSISLNFSNNQIIHTSNIAIGYTTNPQNAYVKHDYKSNNPNVTINSNSLTLHGSKSEATIVTITDLLSEKTNSKLIIFDLYTAPYGVNIPTDRRCNWNQKHSGVTSLYGRKACTLVSGLDVANIYSTNSNGYTPSDMKAFWDKDNGYTWSIPKPGRISSAAYTVDPPKNVETALIKDYIRQSYICYIKNEIYNGRPVIVNLGTDRLNNHSVVAYEYMSTPDISNLEEAPTELNKIKVFDPENGGDNSNIEGRNVTLWEAYRYNFHAKLMEEFVIWGLRPTSPQ